MAGKTPHRLTDAVLSQPTSLAYVRRHRFACSLILVGLGTVLLLTLACSGEDEPRITFVSDRDGDPEVYVMRTDGSDQDQLTNNSAIDSEPQMSPDGKWIAYVSEESGDREINLVEVGKEKPSFKRLTSSPGADEMHRWSPDGGRIAFVSGRDGQPEVYLVNSDGSNFTRVTSDPSSPSLSGWSPDGQWIAFNIEDEQDSPGIITRNPDGVNVRRLTNDLDYGAIWSPDGQRIVFTSERDGNKELYIMNDDGSGQTRLTHNTSSDAEPAWSPDGKVLAFVSDRDGNFEIYTMRVDGAEQTRHTYNDAKDESPAWSRDGTRLAFVSYMYGTAEIIIMDSDGDKQARLTNNNANDTQPSW